MIRRPSVCEVIAPSAIVTMRRADSKETNMGDFSNTALTKPSISSCQVSVAGIS